MRFCLPPLSTLCVVGLLGCNSSSPVEAPDTEPTPACSPSSVVPGPPPVHDPFAPPRTVHFRKVLERKVPEVPGSRSFPSGLAVTPDGRWIISLGFSNATVTLYDAATLEVVAGPVTAIDSVSLGQPHAVVVSPDGKMAVMTNRTGVIGFCLPSLELVFLPHTAAPRHVVRDRAGENYYVSGEGFDVVRLTREGEPQAVFKTEGITGIALTRDDRELLVLTDFGRTLVILRTPDLDPRLLIELPFKGEAVVPLRDRHAIIIGGTPIGGDTSVGLPIMALPVHLDTGAVDSVQVLVEGTGGIILLGDGNEWTDAGESTAIVPTAAGTVTIDTNDGTVALHPAADLEEGIPPCCDIGSYPEGDRVVFSALDISGVGGSLIIYEVEERVAPTSNLIAKESISGWPEPQQ